MELSDLFSASNPCKRFDDNKSLFEGLANMNNNAILCLQTKALPMVKKIVAGYGLPKEKAEEILNSATLIFLKKIETGNYQFQGHALVTYFIEITKRQALMATRSLKEKVLFFDQLPETTDPDSESINKGQEAAEEVNFLLSKIGQPCEQIIRLQYIDGYSDEEVINLKLTKYSTVNSLKMKRSDCMKKLVQIAQQWKKSKNI
ncbi:MAG TPA: hypothetical protein PKC40_10230 [Saprospiraceae bacterium]|nr:hypothetical protein [Saprospiraceae bacterium]